MGAKEELAYRFWLGLYNSDAGKVLFREHEDLRGTLPYDLRRRMPLTLHEDAAPYSKGQSVSVLNVSSPLGIGKQDDLGFVFATAINTTGAKVQSDDPGWKMVL